MTGLGIFHCGSKWPKSYLDGGVHVQVQRFRQVEHVAVQRVADAAWFCPRHAQLQVHGHAGV